MITRRLLCGAGAATLAGASFAAVRRLTCRWPSIGRGPSSPCGTRWRLGSAILPVFSWRTAPRRCNLDSRGRAEARAIGDTLRHAGLGRAPVYSSRWCRCLEAAELLALGPVIPLPALDPFFGEPVLRGTRTAALRAFLAVEGAAGPPTVLVTHQVSALTGRGTRSGEGVVLRRLPDGGLEELMSLPPPSVSSIFTLTRSSPYSREKLLA